MQIVVLILMLILLILFCGFTYNAFCFVAGNIESINRINKELEELEKNSLKIEPYKWLTKNATRKYIKKH